MAFCSMFCSEIKKKCNYNENAVFRDSILTEIVDSLLYEWEESAPPSVAVQQLVSLLSKPVIKVMHDWTS